MIRKTEGIVLRSVKHQESNQIVTLYTKEFGIKSFILTGYRSTRSRRRHSYFQPMSIVEVVFQERPNRDLHKVSESKVAHLLYEVQTAPVKLSLGLAMVEIFFDVVKEEEPQLQLYVFFRQVIIHLDQSPKRLIQIFIFFLVHLTRYLGFFPYDASDESPHVSFDLTAGTLKASTEANEEVALLRRFMYSQLIHLPDPNSCQQITFDQQRKRGLIRLLFDYYREHITGFRYPQTMKVFAEVFG